MSPQKQRTRKLTPQWGGKVSRKPDHKVRIETGEYRGQTRWEVAWDLDTWEAVGLLDHLRAALLEELAEQERMVQERRARVLGRHLQ